MKCPSAYTERVDGNGEFACKNSIPHMEVMKVRSCWGLLVPTGKEICLLGSIF